MYPQSLWKIRGEFGSCPYRKGKFPKVRTRDKVDVKIGEGFGGSKK
jgi:hypothetical protein